MVDELRRLKHRAQRHLDARPDIARRSGEGLAEPEQRGGFFGTRRPSESATAKRSMKAPRHEVSAGLPARNRSPMSVAHVGHEARRDAGRRVSAASTSTFEVSCAMKSLSKGLSYVFRQQRRAWAARISEQVPQRVVVLPNRHPPDPGWRRYRSCRRPGRAGVCGVPPHADVVDDVVDVAIRRCRRCLAGAPG